METKTNEVATAVKVMNGNRKRINANLWLLASMKSTNRNSLDVISHSERSTSPTYGDMPLRKFLVANPLTDTHIPSTSDHVYN
jgi:hypothetical protein